MAIIDKRTLHNRIKNTSQISKKLFYFSWNRIHFQKREMIKVVFQGIGRIVGKIQDEYVEKCVDLVSEGVINGSRRH